MNALMFLFDTDHFGILQWRSQPEFDHLSKRIARHHRVDIYSPIVSFHEQILGWNAYLARAKTPAGLVKG